MKRFILFLWLLIAAPITSADMVTITWDTPTARTDGTPLPLEQIAHYRLYVDDVLLPEAINAGLTTTALTLAAGTRCFKMTTVDLDGRESAFSNEVCKELKAPANALIIDVVVTPEGGTP